VGQPGKNRGKLPGETKRGITTLYSIRWRKVILASWPVLLMHDLVGIGMLFLMFEIWQQWKAVRSFEPRWSREWARQ